MLEQFLDPNSGAYYSNLTMLIIGPIAIAVIVVGFYFIFRSTDQKQAAKYRVSEIPPAAVAPGHIVGTEKYKRKFEHGPKAGGEPTKVLVTTDLATGESTPVSESPEGKMWAKIEAGVCPSCMDTNAKFREGPSGGMSVNISCAGCGARFNVTPVIGIAQPL